MVNHSLNEFSSFVNQQMLSVEDLSEHLSKASALMQVALCYDFSEFSEKTLYNYLWALSDIIETAYTCSLHSLKDVFAANRVVHAAMTSQLNPKEMTS